MMAALLTDGISYQILTYMYSYQKIYRRYLSAASISITRLTQMGTLCV